MGTRTFLRSLALSLPILAISFLSPVRAKGSRKQKGAMKVTANKYYAPMDINNIFNYYGNNGDGSFNKFSTTNEGFEFPVGSNVGTTIFEDGLVWTAIKNDTLFCGGSTYNHGLQAGPIVTDGSATNPPIPGDTTDPANRIYRVRPDIRPTTNSDTANLELAILQNSEVPYVSRFESKTQSQLRQQYWDDWNQWPADEGAPYTDVNHDGKYEPTIDIPGFPDADQTEWMVMNDVNRTLTLNLYGSGPIGIEIQRTIWAYNRTGAMGNTIFIRYKFINKSGVNLDSVYVAQWADPDLGYSADDAVGCDTSRSLGFVYNGQARDANFASLGLPPPAIGFDFLQGPAVPGSKIDSAVFDMHYRPGFRNLPLTAFSFFINSDTTTYGDPELAKPAGAQEWFNLMRGRVSHTGVPFIDPKTNSPTSFVFSGDPVDDTGWTYLNDGSVKPADVRMALCSGPFSMAPGDTQEVVVAAIAGLGADNLSSISVLKANDDLVQSTYDDVFGPLRPQVVVTPKVPAAYELFQNYPNPFNPSTKIRYSLPVTSRVVIKIYDIMGQEVKTLEDGAIGAGARTVEWNSTNDSGRLVSSGLYFCRIQATSLSGDKSFVEVRKMLLLK